LKNLLPNFLENEGPAFLELKVKPGSRINLGRPTLRPIDNKKVFMNYLKR
jgi:phosphonopyruvate decarboxylase